MLSRVPEYVEDVPGLHSHVRVPRSELASGQVCARLVGKIRKDNVAPMTKYLTQDHGEILHYWLS